MHFDYGQDLETTELNFPLNPLYRAPLTLTFNHQWRFLASSGFSHMLSVGAIRFEDRFCGSRRGSGSLWVTVHGGWLQLAVENTSFTLYGLHFWHFRQLLVCRSIVWMEGLDYWTLTNEWVWLRSWTHRECVNKLWLQASSASSKQKWKHKPRKVLGLEWIPNYPVNYLLH